jgi:outer membrane immunogenic protein
MKKLLVTGIAAAAFCGAPALAADMPVKAPAIPPVFNWTGFYAGVDAGGIWGRANELINDDPCCTARMTPNGFTGGGHVGYRWMYAKYVLGWEADLWGTTAKDDVANTDFPEISHLKIRAGGSARLVAGVPVDRSLFYLTGGVSVVDLNACTSVPDVACDTNHIQGFNGTRVGWVAGVGAAFALAANWIARIEYLHSDYGSHNFTATGFIAPSVIAINHFTTDVVRVGLSYQFGDPWGKSPVVAKY